MDALFVKKMMVSEFALSVMDALLVKKARYLKTPLRRDGRSSTPRLTHH